MPPFDAGARPIVAACMALALLSCADDAVVSGPDAGGVEGGAQDAVTDSHVTADVASAHDAALDVIGAETVLPDGGLDTAHDDGGHDGEHDRGQDGEHVDAPAIPTPTVSDTQQPQDGQVDDAGAPQHDAGTTPHDAVVDIIADTAGDVVAQGAAADAGDAPPSPAADVQPGDSETQAAPDAIANPDAATPVADAGASSGADSVADVKKIAEDDVAEDIEEDIAADIADDVAEDIAAAGGGIHANQHLGVDGNTNDRARMIDGGRLMNRFEIPTLRYANDKKAQGRLAIASMPRHLALTHTAWGSSNAKKARVVLGGKAIAGLQKAEWIKPGRALRRVDAQGHGPRTGTTGSGTTCTPSRR